MLQNPSLHKLSVVQSEMTVIFDKGHTEMNSKFGRWTGLKAADFQILKKGQYRRRI